MTNAWGFYQDAIDKDNMSQEIRKLGAEVERLRADRDKWQYLYERSMVKRRAALERLREALRG